MNGRPTVAILNPTQHGLAHYEAELADVLIACGVEPKVTSIPEPGRTDTGRLRWMVDYLRAIRAASATADHCLAIWPALGYLDAAALRASWGSRWSLVIHDPEPLVYARGYGRAALCTARAAGLAGRVITHSDSARLDVPRELEPVTVLPHPMLSPRRVQHMPTRRPVVRVLGRYKPDRDLSALTEIAKFNNGAWDLEIVGRDWPHVDGWKNEDRHVSNEEFDAKLTSSAVVVIPYRRFYQSGVAVRALEAGIPAVGPSIPAMLDMIGSDAGWDAGAKRSWPAAIANALGDSALATDLALARRHLTVDRWQSWIRGLGLGAL